MRILSYLLLAVLLVGCTSVYGQDDLAKEMTPSQISEAQKLAREFKPKKEKP